MLKELFHNSVQKLFWPTSDGSKIYFSVILFSLYTLLGTITYLFPSNTIEDDDFPAFPLGSRPFQPPKIPKQGKLPFQRLVKEIAQEGSTPLPWVDIATICQGKPETNGCNKTNVYVFNWILPPPCDSGKLRLIVIPDPKHVIILVVTGIQGGGHIKGI